jgi:hypothetical protein
MKWSASLPEFTGIRVYVHATFLILIAWVDWETARSVEAGAGGFLSSRSLRACCFTTMSCFNACKGTIAKLYRSYSKEG